MGLLLNRENRRLRRLKMYVGTRLYLNLLLDRPGLSDEQKVGIQAILLNRDGELDTLVDMAMIDMPDSGLVALSKEEQAEGATGRPLIDWFINGGGAWLYSIAMIVAEMFGFKLPPLPPLPPPPPPKPS